MGPDAASGNLRVVEGHPVHVLDDVAKSDQDRCSYRHLTLPNGLKALLVSEPGLDKVRENGFCGLDSSHPLVEQCGP